MAAALVDEAVARFGGLDVLVSNAGFADRTPLATLTDAAMTALDGGDPGRVLPPGARRDPASAAPGATRG